MFYRTAFRDEFLTTQWQNGLTYANNGLTPGTNLLPYISLKYEYLYIFDKLI